MSIEVFLFILLFTCMPSVPLFILYSIHKENKDVLKKAKTIKAGDLYKWEYHYSDPFREPTVLYAKILEIRFADDDVPWVKYSICGVSELIKVQKLSDFLHEYISYKEEKK